MRAIRVIDAQPVTCQCGRRDVLLTLSCGHAKVVTSEVAVAETVAAAIEYWAEAVTACPRGCAGAEVIAEPAATVIVRTGPAVRTFAPEEDAGWDWSQREAERLREEDALHRDFGGEG